MTGGLVDQARRLNVAERRWLADARDRLRRTRAAAPAAIVTTGKAAQR